MNWFRNLSIVKKLVFSFAIAGAMGAATLVCGVLTIRLVLRSNAALYEHGVRPLEQVTRLSSSGQQALINLREIGRETEEEDIREQVRLGQVYSSEASQSLDQLEASAGSPLIRQLIEEYHKNNSSLQVEVAKLDELRLAGKGQQTGQILVQGDLKRIAGAQVDLINRISAEVTLLAKQTNEQSRSIVSSSLGLMIGLAIAGGLLEVLLCWIMIRTIGSVVGELRLAAERLAVGDPEVQITVRSHDELGALADSFRRVAAMYEDRARITQRIAAGDMNVALQVACERDVMGKSLQLCASNVQALMQDSTQLAAAALAGKLDVRADAGRYTGGFREVIESLNRTFEELRKPLRVATHVLEKFSHGELPWPIREEYQGEYDNLKESTNRVIAVAKQRQDGVETLLQAAIEGRLEERADATTYEGSNRKLFDGINQLLDAVLLPIEEGNRVLRQIRGGNLRERMEIECKGDHQKMKEAVNGVHGWLNELVDYVTRIANGDMSARMETASEDDQRQEWLVLLKSNIVRLQEELGRLIQAAQKGDLLARGDPAPLQGSLCGAVELGKRNVGSILFGYPAGGADERTPFASGGGTGPGLAGDELEYRSDRKPGKGGLGGLRASEPQHSDGGHGSQRNGRQHQRYC